MLDVTDTRGGTRLSALDEDAGAVADPEALVKLGSMPFMLAKKKDDVRANTACMAACKPVGREHVCEMKARESQPDGTRGTQRRLSRHCSNTTRCCTTHDMQTMSTTPTTYVQPRRGAQQPTPTSAQRSRRVELVWRDCDGWWQGCDRGKSRWDCCRARPTTMQPG